MYLLGVDLANKIEKTNSERANEREEREVINLLLSLSLLSPSPALFSFYRGGGRGGFLYAPR
jgi:hypothetical protein